MTPAPIRAIALETTSRRGEVALVEQGRVVAQDAFEAGLGHTAHLLPLVDRLCRSLDWRPGDIEEIYVSIGPGGFTGTRIGVTFAKTFAFATAARLVAVPTPRVLVENAPAEASHALVVVDARRGKAWVEPFIRVAGLWQSAGSPQVTTLTEALTAAPRPVWLVGEGVSYHAAEIDPADTEARICPDTQPRAAVVASVGWEMARQGGFVDPFSLVPVYVRRPEAEEKRLGLE